jgi:hypothetical protein
LQYLEDDSHEFEELSRKERIKALDCMLKVMDSQLNQIKKSTTELNEMQLKTSKNLIDIEEHFSKKENQIFKEYHEKRLERKRIEIEEGLRNLEGPNGEVIDEEDEFDIEALKNDPEMKDYA